MLVSVSGKPIIAPKKILIDTRTQSATDYDMLIHGSPIPFSRPIAKQDPWVEICNKLSSSKIFKITFSYLGQVCHTKVLKVTYGGNPSLYKVVLNSSVANNTSICWLEYQTQGWVMLLGQELDERLKLAITVAIECQEF